MNRNELKQLIIEAIGIADDKIPDNPSQENVENWDSLQHLLLIVTLEDRYNISIEPEEIAVMIDLDSIERILTEKI